MPRRANAAPPFFRPSDVSHIGVDEAGRGCLAGPVVAAAVLFSPDADIPALLPGLADSKKLSAAARDALFPVIKNCCLCWGLGLAWPGEIDRVNILNATLRAMARAVSRLRPPPVPFPLLLIDGNHPIRPDAWLAATALPLPAQRPVVDGDALVPAISAASVLAKVFRDHLMTRLDRRWPGYGFAAHKGYGTTGHLAAIHQHGPCPLHRRSFRKVRPEQEQLSLI